MNKRDSGLLDFSGAAKRFRGNDDLSGNLGNDPSLLTAVGQLLAAATSGASGSQNQLAQLLANALTQSQGAAPAGADHQAASLIGGLVGGSGGSSSRPLGKWDAVVIPSICVGWLKGKQGAMVREIEARSGAVVDIDQSTKDMGHCTVNMHGDEEAKRKAYGFVVAEMLKVADQPGSNMDCSAIGTKLPLFIDAKFVGWVKGPRGKVVQDITTRSNTRVDVDQSSLHLGNATINIYGTHENVQYARELIAFEISKVSPEAAAEIGGVEIPGMPNSGAESFGSSSTSFLAGGAVQVRGNGGALSQAPPTGPHGSLQIPSSYVGWLKGRQGQMIRDIEARSGATVDIDQSTKEMGHCTVNIRGPEEQKKKAFGLIVAEVMKVSDQSGVPVEGHSVGTKIEIPIDGKFVGWVKGPKGKVVQDITQRSCTRVDVDQSSADMSRAVVKVYGTHEGVQCAKDLIAFEISKVSPEAAAEIQGHSGMSTNMLQLQGGQAGGCGNDPVGQALLASGNALPDSGRWSCLTMPSSYVGWIKGKQGAMVRDIEARSGAVVDIDQSTKELGHVQVNFRGGEEEKRKAYGLVVAEVVKVSDQGGTTYDCTHLGTKCEIRIEGKYVGWVKGPRGKVVQDISTRSSTRVDMDQSNDSHATVKIYGTHEGVQAAKEFLAFEISKVSPEAAAEISGGGQSFMAFQQPGDPVGLHSQHQHQQHVVHAPQPMLSAPCACGGMGGVPDLSAITAMLASAVGQQQGFHDSSGQQAAAAQLTQSYLEQLAAVAPNLVTLDQAAAFGARF